jgi:Na+/melibiose symporter-like transporter
MTDMHHSAALLITRSSAFAAGLSSLRRQAICSSTTSPRRNRTITRWDGRAGSARERVEPVCTHVKLTPSIFVKTIVTNGPLLVLILMTLFSISAYNIKTAMVIYYTQYYLGDASVLPCVNFIAIGASVIGIIAMPSPVKRFG